MVLALLPALWFAPCAVRGEGAALVLGARDDPPLFRQDGLGMVDRLLREAFARAGVEARFVTLPSERSITEANAGTIDGDANRVEGVDRTYTNLVRVPESTVTWEFTVFTMEPGLHVTGWKGLAGCRVGYLVGWKIIEERLKGLEAVGVARPRELFRLLAAGRVDAVIYQRLGGGLLLDELGIPRSAVRAEVLERREMYVYLNRRHEALVPRLAEALRSLKQDGTRERFLAEPAGE
ncbi:hypothetical protein NNJEOMEG_01402 [Fundidesulfovibrio magnetotacticus]|uniref:Solute-binding protein family 3/N-terminal domain-containing protein n=1 Tax=Fundidesulfovibrio magnetotacticus TaxID=2730080 RepID=A0A6V8LTB9_9BACT|nr:transporter substrate-binding domain-containing protein [Fundidesulfovibrio magnetotacticus]GFK93568.1 hypothetical protein NNJEOMEG_01402 [Fundidesulfovibrio magnetotacticus]